MHWIAMEIALSETLEFPVEGIKAHVDISQIDNFSAFSAVRLARKHYERLGFFVAEGADFEDNMSCYFFDKDRLFRDEYTKVKLGKSRMTDARQEYCGSALEIMAEPDVRLLLVLCRFCSYTGAPGFPDLIIAKDGIWKLVYVMFDELPASQKMFLLLSKLAGVRVEVVSLDKHGTVKIDPFGLLNSILGDRRAKSILTGLEENIREAESKAEASPGVKRKIWEDEADYLSEEKAKNSLFLFRKWAQQGFASASSLKGAVHFVLTHDRHGFEAHLQELEKDEAFASIRGRTEDAMKRRAEYMQEKFGLGRSRSKMLLNFF